jgi:hypothetical protein
MAETDLASAYALFGRLTEDGITAVGRGLVMAQASDSDIATLLDLGLLEERQYPDSPPILEISERGMHVVSDRSKSESQLIKEAESIYQRLKRKG